MTTASMAELVVPARAAGRAVVAFNVIGMEHAEAIVAGAEAAAAPVVLAVSENCVRYHGALEPLGKACAALARSAAVPVALHLDHATTTELVATAAGLEFGSVMFDASALPYEANVRSTTAVARWCHDRGIWVEAELGEIGGKNGVHSPLARTDPGEAASYVRATRVDALAVAVGSSHAMLSRDAVLDIALIGRLRRAVDVPLVLHGSSGVPDEGLANAIRAGMTKVNIATQLNKVYTAAVRRVLAADPSLADPRQYGRAGRTAITAEVTRLLTFLSAAPGAAAQARLPRAREGTDEPLSPVE
jgi:fructose-bisphosphate aldolase class II